MHMMAHLSYEHMTDGVSPASLAPYNAHVLAALVSRLRGVDVNRNATPIAAAEPPGRPVVTADAGARMSSSSSYSAALHGRMTSDDPQSRSTENHRPSLRRERPPLRLLVWIDVANVELGAGEVLLEMIRSKAFRPLLQHIPIGWCTTQELFVPHPCATLHAAHQLSCRHPHSDFFPFYALTRVESGDLAMAHLLSQVRRATGRDSPGMVLMTLDALQRQCATELFGWGPGGGGGVITPLAVTPSAMYHAMLQALGDGIG